MTIVNELPVDLFPYNNGNTFCTDVHAFDNYCKAFIMTVVGTGKEGLFGKVCGYYGRVQEDHNGMLCLHIFVWPAAPQDSDAYDTHSILVWGDANNSTHPLSSTGIFYGKLLHESFSFRALGNSMSLNPYLAGHQTVTVCLKPTIVTEHSLGPMLWPPCFMF
jgi:hypothetical protein